MTFFPALYFPDTLPPSAAVAPLAGLLGSLTALRPLGGESLPAPWSQLAAEGALQLTSPALPDPTMTEQLRALLKELDDSRGDAALLFARNLAAGLSANREEQATELVAPLLGQAPEPTAVQAREELWQALLLLQLHETLECRELELEEELQKIDSARGTLFNQLRGEEMVESEAERASPDRPGPKRPLAPPRPWRNVPRLLRAWGRLFALDSNGAKLLLTADREVWGQLLDYGTAGDQDVISLGKLILPTDAPQLSGQAEGASERLYSALLKAAADGESEGARAAVTDWNRQIPESDQDANYLLELVLCPGLSPQKLISRAADLPEAADAPTGSRPNSHALLGLCTTV